MEKQESKSRYFGQIVLIVLLQAIMMVFKLVEPIHWPQIFPRQYTGLMNEFAYFGIELILFIWIVAHGIFSIPYSELGFRWEKGNWGRLALNGIYLVGASGIAYVMSQFNRQVELDIRMMIAQIITNFIAIACINELVFRGFLWRAFYKLTNKKGILTSLVTALLFAATYTPSVLISLEVVSVSGVFQKLIIPFGMGLFLGLIYYYGKNLWMCCVIQGVLLSLLDFPQDFVLVAIEIVYGVILVSYLIYLMVQFYKYGEFNEEDEDEIIQDEEEIETKALSIEPSSNKQVISDKEEKKHSQEKYDDELEVFETKKKNTLLENTDSITPKLEIPHFESQLVESQKAKESVVEDFAEEDKAQENERIPDLFSMLSNTEEYGKDKVTLNEKVRTQKAESSVSHFHNEFEETVKISDVLETHRKEVIQAEPNFIEHLENALGEFEAIYKQIIPTNPPIDILYFKGEEVNALVTNGMRYIPMNVPTELQAYKNIELMMFVDKQFDLSTEGLMEEENTWLIKLISELAIYPGLTNSYLGWGHIVGNGETLTTYSPNVKYCGALIYPPINGQNVQFYQYKEKGTNVFIYDVMPLYKEELTFIKEQSSDQFINLLASMGMDQTILPRRLNVIKSLKHS